MFSAGVLAAADYSVKEEGTKWSSAARTLSTDLQTLAGIWVGQEHC